MRYVPPIPTVEQIASLKATHGTNYIGPVRPSPDVHPRLVVFLRYATRADLAMHRAYKASGDPREAAKASDVFASACIIWPETSAEKQRLFDEYPMAATTLSTTLHIYAGSNTDAVAAPISEEEVLSFRPSEG